MGVRRFGLVLLVVLASACGNDDETKESFGSATVTVADAGGANIAPEPFVVKTISASIGGQCTGGVPGISQGDCVSSMSAKVEAEGQSVTLGLWTSGVEGDDRARRVTGGSVPAITQVQFSQGTSQQALFWAQSITSKFERATVSVAADGRVTYDIASVLEPSRFSKGTGTVRIEVSVTIDCKPDGPNAAICQSRSGPPRQ